VETLNYCMERIGRVDGVARLSHKTHIARNIGQGTVRQPFRLSLFECEELSNSECKLGLRLWSGFLCGQSMLVPQSERCEGPCGREGQREYDAVLRVYDIAEMYDHVDAEDAALDATRDLLCHRGDLWLSSEYLLPMPRDTMLNRIVMDFVVYCGHGTNWTDLVDATASYPKDHPKCVPRLVKENKETHSPGQLLCISNDICQMLIPKETDAIAGRPPPDLMERCRYHSHVEKGLRRYLDN
jgi:hypothetical protein